MSVRDSLHGMLRLIRVDTLRRVHNVGFLAARLICSTIRLMCVTKYDSVGMPVYFHVAKQMRFILYTIYLYIFYFSTEL